MEALVNPLRSVLLETFPEPNRRLLQRILKMMHTIAAHASENRMTPSTVAACMALLLLRPLLAGGCELEEDFDMSGDNSAQLLSAENAANSAQAIVTTLLEEYDSIFDTRAELEEIALAEADVIRLKQKLAELHNQLNQQRQHQHRSLMHVTGSSKHRIFINSQQKFLQQDFDMTLAFVNHGKKQQSENHKKHVKSSLGHWKCHWSIDVGL